MTLDKQRQPFLHGLLTLAFSIFVLCFCLPSLLQPGSSYGQNNTVASVSAASYLPALAPEAMAAAYGQKLATGTLVASIVPLPTTLAGTIVRVNGMPAPLFFVSPNQINYLIPAGTAPGNAEVVVTSGDGTVSTGMAQVSNVAPAIFTANSSGKGLPAATIFRLAANGTQSYESVVEFNAATNSFRLRPIDLGPEGERVFLILYLSGIRNANQDAVRVLLGGQSLPVSFVGAAGGFAGLDQINLELPRNLIGSGVISLSVGVAGFTPSNEISIEIAGTRGIAPPQIAGFGPTIVLAGSELVITGSGFSSTLTDNKVRITDDQGQSEAQVLEATATRLRVLVPFGAGTGKISVRTPQGENENPATLTLRTSVSGFVQDTRRQPIRGVTVRMSGTNLSVQTNAEGAFLLPDTPPSTSAIIEIDGTTVSGGLPYPKQQFKMRVIGNRDNQVGEYIELKQATGSSLPIGNGFSSGQSLVSYAEWPTNSAAPEVQIQTGQVILDVPNNAAVRFPGGGITGSLTLTVLESGRTPSTLPAGQFSPVIAQITPFGATINPGAKLTFPNPDGYAPNSALKLYRYDQTPNSPTLGEFVEAGTATVSADGQRIESAANAVTETTYYFASGVRPTITLIGRVVENNLNRAPVRRSLVNVRGQGIFTDGNGGFVVRNVPINASSAFAAQSSGEILIEAGVGEIALANDRISVEADFMRPSTRVDRSQQEQVLPVATGPTISPDLVLSSTSANRAPTIFAPADITMNAGTTRDVTFFASDPDAGQILEVAVSGASFATVRRGNNDDFTLRLTPGGNDGGNYTLTLTVSDGLGGMIVQNILLRVNGIGVIADAQAVTVDRNIPKSIRLTGSDPANRPLTFEIVSQPARGTLNATAPDVIYTPAKDYAGEDRFTFKVRAGQVESNEATITIRVRQSNAAPILIVPNAQTVNAGQPVSFTVTASDPDVGQSLSFDSPLLPSGAAVSPTSATSLQFSWTPAVTQVGVHNVAFTVRDNGTPPASATQSVSITVRSPSLSGAKWAKTTTSILEGGYISVLLASGDTLFAGTNNSGIYRSTNQGQSWVSINDGLGSFASINALLVHESRLFAGTGGGVYVSENNGRSWTAAGLQQLWVRALAARDGRIYAGTVSGGVSSSADFGKTWTPINQGLFTGSISALTVSSDGYLLAGTREVTGLGFGVFRLPRNGTLWEEVNTGLPQTSLGVGVLAMATSGTNLFLATENRMGSRLFISNNQGTNWSPVNTGLPEETQFPALIVHENRILAASKGAGLIASSDNGQHWQPVGQGLGTRNLTALASSGSVLFTGTDSDGVFRLTGTEQNWTESNTGLTSGRSIQTVAAAGNNLYVVTNQGLIASTTNGQSWELRNNGLAPNTSFFSHLAVQGETLFASGWLSSINRRFYLSADGGRNWRTITATLPNSDPVNCLAVGGANLFIGRYEEVLISKDQGQTWQSVSTGLPISRNVVDIVIDGINLYAVTFGAGAFSTEGGVYRSRNLGQTWTDISPKPLVTEGFSSFLADGQNLYAGSKGKVYVSLDQGQSWQSFSAGLPPDSTVSLAMMDGNLIAGTNSGAYVSTNNGQRWTIFNPGLTNLAVTGLTVNQASLFAGTASGGVFRVEANAPAWDEVNTGLANKFVNTVIANETNLFAGTLGSGLFRSSNGGRGWEAASAGLPPNANIQSFATNNMRLWAATFGDGVYRSTNQGASWTAVNTGLNNKFVNQLFASGTTLYAGTEGGVYRSLDSGNNWTLINTGMGTLPVDSFVALGGTVYAGTDGNGVFRLNGDGVSWTRKNSGLTSQQVRALGVNGNVLYAGTIGGGICISRDSGDTWMAVNNQLPSTLNVFSFAVSGQKVYAGSVYGIFVTENEGRNWTQTNAGLLNTYVTGLAVSGEELFASTASGGVFVSRIP